MRTMTLRGIFIVAAALALSIGTAHAQTLIKGKVVDAQNKPVEGALIHFEQKDANTKRDAKSDKKGEFLFVGLPSGDYKVTASKDGMTDEHNTKISGDQQAFVSFQLRPKADVAAAAANPTAGLSTITSSATAAGNASEADAIKPLITSALEAYNANNYKDAIPRFNEVVKKLPTCEQCYLYLAISYFASNEPEQAEGSLKKSIAIKPTPEAYNLMANMYNMQQKKALADEAMAKAAELSAAAEAEKAAAAAKVAEKQAVEDKVVVVQNTTANTYNDGVKLWNEGKYAEAQAKFEEAIKADPKNADAHYMLGMANINANKMAAARAEFQQYLTISPDGDKAAQVKTFLTQLPK
jgi:tetratricopeptide (TPR) repeat protein